jgi:hypothetical protein
MMMIFFFFFFRTCAFETDEPPLTKTCGVRFLPVLTFLTFLSFLAAASALGSCFFSTEDIVGDSKNLRTLCC